MQRRCVITLVANQDYTIDELIFSFIEKNEKAIATMHSTYLLDKIISIQTLILELIDHLKTVTYIFLESNSIEDLDAKLFYSTNEFCKKKFVPIPQKDIIYLCPGCLFLNKQNIIHLQNDQFKCEECYNSLCEDIKKNNLFKTFLKHNKNGFRCMDCNRFIPNPIDNDTSVSCPYYDCAYVGNIFSLKKMNHPTLKGDNQIIITPKEVEVKELSNKAILLKEIISSQIKSIAYNSSNFTMIHKYLAYKAIDNLINKYPTDMVNYLLHNSRSGGFQHKIFQEYIYLLEKSLPFSYKKNNLLYNINSLLDKNLNLFDGISSFEGIVSDKLVVKNNTKEFYIGGRKSSYTKPYYIGKLLSISNKKTGQNLINNVKEYSFSKIQLINIAAGTQVVIDHLRVPPHYQMGGMVYINRVRKLIVDEAKLSMNCNVL